MLKVIKKAAVYIISAGLFVAILSGCISLDTKTYKSWDNLSKIEVDGIQYEMMDRTKWELDNEAKLVMIGETGGIFSKAGVYVIEGDIERNFILIHEGFSSMWRTTLVRTDKVIPEPSADTVTRLKCSGAYRSAEGKIKSFEFITDEADVIRNLFALFNNTKTKDADDFTYYRTMINCYSDDLPGIFYPLQLRSKDRQFICGNYNNNHFVDIPYELLEKISQKKSEALIIED